MIHVKGSGRRFSSCRSSRLSSSSLSPFPRRRSLVRLVTQPSALLLCLLLPPLLLILTSAPASGQDARINSSSLQTCDRVFVSSPSASKNGSFLAPSLLNKANHSRQCIYTFEAGAKERVEVTFTSFNLRGAHPEYVSNTKTTRDREKKREKPSPSLFPLPPSSSPSHFP